MVGLGLFSVTEWFGDLAGKQGTSSALEPGERGKNMTKKMTKAWQKHDKNILFSPSVGAGEMDLCPQKPHKPGLLPPLSHVQKSLCVTLQCIQNIAGWGISSHKLWFPWASKWLLFHLWGQGGISGSGKGEVISQLPLAADNCFESRRFTSGFHTQVLPSQWCPLPQVPHPQCPEILEPQGRAAAPRVSPPAPRGPAGTKGSLRASPPAPTAVSLHHEGQLNSLQSKNEVLWWIEGSSLTLRVNVLVSLDGKL